MNHDRELIHAALQWHAAHVHRMAVGTVRRRLDKALKADNGQVFSPLHRQQGDVARRLTEAKRLELAALRQLAKACARQRDHFDLADVIDLGIEAKLLPCVA